MRILNYSNSKDRQAVEKLLRREPLVSLKGAGSRASLTKKVFGKDLTPEQAVNRIVEDVQKRGDSALFVYCRKFDGFAANNRNIRVTKRRDPTAALNQLNSPWKSPFAPPSAMSGPFT